MHARTQIYERYRQLVRLHVFIQKHDEYYLCWKTRLSNEAVFIGKRICSTVHTVYYTYRNARGPWLLLFSNILK